MKEQNCSVLILELDAKRICIINGCVDVFNHLWKSHSSGVRYVSSSSSSSSSTSKYWNFFFSCVFTQVFLNVFCF